MRRAAGPLRRGVPAPQPGGLDELRGHDPRGGLAGQARPGEQRESRAAGAEVLVARPTIGSLALRRAAAGRRDLGRLLHPDVREQAGQDGDVDAVGVPRERELAGPQRVVLGLGRLDRPGGTEVHIVGRIGDDVA